MKQQDKLRETLRGYYDNQAEPFSNHEWESAKHYLEVARSKRRKRHILFLLIIPFFAALIIAFNFSSSFNSKEQQLAISTNQKLKSAMVERQKNSSPSPTPSIAFYSQKNASKGINSRQLVSANVTRLKNHKNTPALNPHVLFTKETKDHPTDKVVQTPISYAQESNTNEENNATILDSKSKASVAVTTTNQKESSRLVTEDTIKSEEAVAKHVENLTQNENQFSVKEENQLLINELALIKYNNTLNDSKKETKADNVQSAEFQTKEIKTSILPNDSLNSASNDSTNSNANLLPEASPFNFYASNWVFFEAGAAWYYGWKGPLRRDARGLSPLLGIHYMNLLSKQLAFSFGIQYLRVGNLSNSSKTSSVSAYYYGEQNRVTVITPYAIHYLVAPIKLHYYINQNNCFGLGVNLAYLLNVDATVKSYDQKPGFIGNYSTVKLSGYKQGFSPFDSQLSFSYRRRIASMLELQTEIFVGLTDVKEDQFFGFKSKERNSGAKLSLIYSIIKKSNKK